MKIRILSDSSISVLSLVFPVLFCCFRIKICKYFPTLRMTKLNKNSKSN